MNGRIDNVTVYQFFNYYIAKPIHCYIKILLITNYLSLMKLPYAEPYRIKMVEEIRQSTREEREEWLKNSKYNLFNLKSSKVYID